MVRAAAIAVFVWLLVFPVSGNDGEYVVEEPVTESDPMSVVISLRVFTYAVEGGTLQKVLNVFTPAWAEESGIAWRTDWYSGRSAPVRFESTYTDKFRTKSGFLWRADTLDENGVVLSTELTPVGFPSFTLNADDAQALDRFPLRRLSFFTDTYGRKITDARVYDVQSPLHTGSSFVVSRGTTAALTPLEKTLLEQWSALHGVPGFERFYTGKLLVNDGDREQWISVRQDFPSGLAAGTPLFVRSWFVGSCAEGQVFAAGSVRPVVGPSTAAEPGERRRERIEGSVP